MYGFASILMDLNGFSWIREVLGPGCRPPVAALYRPENPCRNGLDPPNIKISDSGGLDLEAWCPDAGCRQDWNGLEEVTEVTAFWGEGIGRTSHTLELQELGGLPVTI